jgi:hypothetical protein
VGSARTYFFTLGQYQVDPPTTLREVKETNPYGNPGRLVTESRLSSESAQVTAKAMRAIADELSPPSWKFWRHVSWPGARRR